METGEFNKIINDIHNDENAEKLYNTYYARLVRVLSKNYGRSNAEDAVQSVFMSLLEPRNKRVYVKNPMFWLITCCANKAKNMVFTEVRQKERERIYLDSIIKTVVSDYEDCYLNELDYLTEDEKKVLYLYHWCGFNHREIGEILNIPGASVRKKYERAIKKFKNFSINVTK